MVVMIESLIGILLFTILIVPLTLKNPLISVGDYPPAIRERCIELGLIEKREQRFTREDIIRKGTALVVLWKNTGITVFISGSPVLVCFLACPPVLQWERLQQSSDQPSNDIKQNMIRIRQEISFEVSCFFFTLKRKEVPHGPSGHQI